ncbi:MAG TPA: putative molybdenum carrier protein [Pyrinomonadaceae bacterium]|nr:putative molybdenum carrier protein [Pyrinomonadaceae bacterium]
MPSKITKIISGGQTGADRAALDWAIDRNFQYGGYVPLGRWAEDGKIAGKYKNLIELDSDDPVVRTEQNVIGSDATLIVANGKLTGGSLFTWRVAGKHRRPVLVAELYRFSLENAADRAREWLRLAGAFTLNVAGPRASKDPSIYGATYDLLDGIFRR